MSNLDDNTITVYGSRDGEWRERALLQTGTLPISIAFGEFNGDGRPDLYVANQLGDSVGIFVAAP